MDVLLNQRQLQVVCKQTEQVHRLWFYADLQQVIMFPLVAKACSDEALVSGMHNYFFSQAGHLWKIGLVLPPPFQQIGLTISPHCL